jgi:hypothetical protein
MALLAAKSLDFGDGQALDADFGQGIFDFLKLEGLDDCYDELHEWEEYLVEG